MRVAIVGLGLIGGSLARDFNALGHEVWGADADATTIRASKRARIVHRSFRPDLQDLPPCELCVIAIPVDATVALVLQRAPLLARAAVITDVGSTKVSVTRAARRAGLARTFVGAHPFAGDHMSGWSTSRRDLFLAAPTFLTPTRATSRRAIGTVRALWRSVGAIPRVVSPAAHDRLMAAASHLPQVVSSVLGQVLAARRIPRAALGPGGRDVTRLAGSNAAVWASILADNGPAIAPLLEQFMATAARLRGPLARGDRRRLQAILAVSRRWAETGT